MSSGHDWKSQAIRLNALARVLGFLLILVVIFPVAQVAKAQVPPDIETKLLQIGPIIDPGCTAKIYRPLMPSKDVTDQLLEMQKTGKPSNQVSIYPGITVERDISFGPDPKDVVDVFHADKGLASRPVLIFVPGGLGNKMESSREGNAFYDNIVRWAAKNGMVSVLMQRHLTPGDYYAGAKDLSAMLQWVEANISKYHGNPDRMFIWAHSAGSGPLGIYAGHPELYGPKGIGAKGIVFMSAFNIGQFDIVRPDGTNPVAPGPDTGLGPGPMKFLAGSGSTCGAAGRLGEGPNAAAGGGRGGPAIPQAPEVSQQETIQRSSLPGLKKTEARIFLASAEFDPGIMNAKPSSFNQALHDELCKVDGPKAVDGRGHCPMLVVEKGHSHMSEVFSVDTADQSVTGPILEWIKSIK
jgi:hypothetical protein